MTQFATDLAYCPLLSETGHTIRPCGAGWNKRVADLIFLADSDLEAPPEILTDLYAAMEDGESDVAFAWQRERAG